MKKTIVTCIVILIIALAGGSATFLPRFFQSSTVPEPPPAVESAHPEAILSEPNTDPDPEPLTVPVPEPVPEAEPESEPLPEQETEAEPEIPASDLTGDLLVTLSDGRTAAALLDRNYTSRLSLRADAYVTISAAEEIHSLYLVWGLPPGQWSISGEQTQTFGEHGFVHEYVTLSSPSAELTLHMPPNGAVLCDIYAFSEGYPPEWVQIWLPPLRRADILVLPTHADDEHLFFAGILPYYAGERGYRVQVAYLTNHWNEPPRPHELLNGLWVVGIRNYPVISGFNDRLATSLQQARDIYGFDNFVNFQVELLRRFKPLVVVGHDLNGEYGHSVHSLGAHALRVAVENAADATLHPDSYRQYGIWDTPKLYLHLYPENAIMMDWDIPLENFGGATAYEMAAAGYDSHRSQHRWAFAVPRPGSVSGHKFGLVRSLVGWDSVGGDLLENVVTAEDKDWSYLWNY